MSATAPSWSSLPHTQLGLGIAVFALVALVTAAPVLVVIAGALDGNVWRETFIDSAVNRSAIGYSFLLGLRAPIAALIGFLIAWLLIRIRLPGGRFIEFAMWVSFFIPLLPVTLSWILLLNPRYGLINQALKSLPFIDAPVFNIYSVGGILWVHIVASSVPVMVVLLGPAIRQLDASFEEIGRVCGSGPFAVFRQITLPILAPVILTGTLAGFIKSLEAFEVEQLLGRPADIYVYSTRIYDLASWEPPNFASAMALSTFVLFVLLLIAIAYQRLSQSNDYATILGRGASYRQLQIGWTRWLISAALFLVVAISLLCPLLMLICGSFMKLFGFFHIPAPYTLNHWRDVLNDPVFSELAVELAAAERRRRSRRRDGLRRRCLSHRAFALARPPHCRSARLVAMVNSRNPARRVGAVADPRESHAIVSLWQHGISDPDHDRGPDADRRSHDEDFDPADRGRA